METHTPDDVYCPQCGCSWNLNSYVVLRLDLANFPIGFFYAFAVMALGGFLNLTSSECLAFGIPAAFLGMLSLCRKYICGECHVEFGTDDEARARKAARMR